MLRVFQPQSFMVTPQTVQPGACPRDGPLTLTCRRDVARPSADLRRPELEGGGRCVCGAL